MKRMPATADVSPIGCLFSMITYSLFSVAPIAVIFLFVRLFGNFRQKAATDQLDRFCQNWLGIPPQRLPGRIRKWPTVETTFNGHPLRITIRNSQREKKSLFSRFELEIPNTNGLELSITNQDFLSNLGRLVGMQDVVTDDELFDNTFVLKANSEERAREVLTEPIRSSLLQRLQNERDSLKLVQGKIVYETGGSFQNDQFNYRFFQMLITAEKIADRLAGGTGDVPQSLLQPRAAGQPRRQAFTGAIDAIARQWPDDEEYLKRLGSRIHAESFMEDYQTSYRTNIKGRKVLLRYSHRTSPKTLRIQVAVTQKFWLKLTPQYVEEIVDEIRITDESLDRKLRIDSDQPDAALRFLNSSIVTRELSNIHPFDSFEISEGNAIYTLDNPRDTGFLHSALENTLQRLNQVLVIYEQQKLDLSISALRTESSICPYCREELEPDKEVIATCNLCKTSHHETCLSEIKQCTTWGCLATEKDFSHSVIERQPENGSEFEIH